MHSGSSGGAAGCTASSNLQRLVVLDLSIQHRHWPKLDAELWPGMNDIQMCMHAGPRQCIGRALARIIHDASVAQLVSHFRFQLAERMGGPEGVDRHEINRLTMQPGQGRFSRPAMSVCRNRCDLL